MKKIFYVIITFLILMSSIYIFISKDFNKININVENNDNNSENNVDIDEILNSMTTEEKVGQLFIYSSKKDDNKNNLYNMNNELSLIIKKYNFSGFILFSENMKDINQTKDLINSLKNQDLKIPMFIAVDAEGGVVDRLASSSLSKSLPYISKLGSTNNYNLAYEYSKIIGRELAYLGFNLDFAPVCDLDNDSLKDCTFSSNSNVVANMIKEYIKGLDSYNIISVLKHFPGLGSSRGDTHKQIVTSDITLNELKDSDFIPFKYGIEAGSNIIMINHVIYNNLSSIKLPASLNKDIYTILRNDLKYKGLIVTDALNMNAVTGYDIDASYAAFMAGADLLLMPKDIDESYNEILEAVKNGSISIDRLDSSVKRIIKYKYDKGLFKNDEKNINFYDEEDNSIIDSINNQ